MMWSPTKDKKYGVAIYNWNGDVRYGLPLEIGDTVQIMEESLGWFRGFLIKNRLIKGIFPTSYIHVKPCKFENEGMSEMVTPADDPVIREVTLVLREWNVIWKNLYLTRATYNFNTLKKVMRELVDARRQLITNTLTQDQMREIKLQITTKIDWGNRKLGLDLVPRCGAVMVDPSTMSIVQLHQMHVQSLENSKGTSARGTLKKKDTSKKSLTRHLYMSVMDFSFCVGEPVEVYFSLFDAKKSKYISERFLVRYSKDRFLNYVDQKNSNFTIFTDLGKADLTKELYIVAHIYRIGKMLYSESNKKILTSMNSNGPGNFRRPYAVGLLNIGDLMMSGLLEEKDFTFKACQTEDKDFYQLHEFIIKKLNNKFSVLSGQNHEIVMSLRVLHGDLPQVKEDNPIVLKNVTLTQKLGFSDVIMPGDVRNDLYVTLEKGEFERGGKSTGKNIEVSVLALDNEGSLLDGCIVGASGMEPHHTFRSSIIYHHNSPQWYETIRLIIPIEKYHNAHVRIEYRHCSTRDKADNKKLLGFSFTKLMEPSGATLPDGNHELVVHRCEDQNKLKPSHYLSSPSTLRELQSSPNPGSSVFATSHKELFTIRSLLCSTKLTQNADLLSLLKWKAHPEKIQDALSRALRLDGEELVKFLQDVLDALFAMFSTEEGNSTAHSGLVFHVLVSILSLLDDSKFEHFKPVMDAYIKNHFAAPLVYKGLLSSVEHCADWVGLAEKQEPIQKCFRSLESIFKFIVGSRLLFSYATSGAQYEESFRRDLKAVLLRLNNVLASDNPQILSSQVSLISSLTGVYEQLVQVLPCSEVAISACNALDSIPLRHIPSELLKAKLHTFDQLVESQLFTFDESRGFLLACICTHLKHHLALKEELKLCTDILGKILTFLFDLKKQEEEGVKPSMCLYQNIEIVCISSLDMLIQTVLIIIDRSTPVLGNLVACLIAVLQLMSRSHYHRLSQSPDVKGLKNLLQRLLLVLRDLVGQNVFSSDWFVMRLATNSVILNAMRDQQVLLRALPTFDFQLWQNYLTLAVRFLTQPSLQLEKFSDVKKEKIIAKYGDMRVQMGFQILEVWSNLGEHKIDFIPLMVGPFLEITLVPENELRKATLHIFFDMIQCEYKATNNFKQVESELIDKLDILISNNKGDDEYRQLFNTILLERIQKEEPDWKDKGSTFITSVTRLLERLLDYRSVIQGDENRDKRMSCTFNLLNFYKNEINREEMYLRYIYKLRDLHVSAENYTEAGFTLLLHANCLTWDLNYQRKLKLYHEILTYFDKAKVWEKGIALLKELAYVYEERLFDYDKLGEVLKTQAKFYDNILKQLRPEPEYFRVGFYGSGFPLFVRNKVFVYRGLEYERYADFTERIQTEFPSAQIYTKNTPPSHALMQSDAQYIQICNVKPLPNINLSWKAEGLAPMPEKVARFYQVNDVSRFQLDRPMPKPPIDEENEFKSLWLERTVLTISNPLPGILRWFEVVDTHVEEVCPVRFACETVAGVNKELASLVTLYTNEPKRDTKHLTMRLQGVIDANVAGGIEKYQKAFFTPEFLRDYPEWLSYVSQLNTLLNDQVEILKSGLVVHGQLAPNDVQPLHCWLLKRLDQNIISLKRPSENFNNSSLSGLSIDSHRPLHGAEEYTNTMGYMNMRSEIYADPEEVPESQDTNDAPPALPARPRSYAVSISSDSSYGSHARGHQRTLSRTMSQKLSSELSLNGEEAPPLPPRGYTPDRRPNPEVPPKRASAKKEDISDSISRDSGFSEQTQLNNLSYEEWTPTRNTAPPPVPPKTAIHDDIQLNIPKVGNPENYSVPKIQNDLENFTLDQSP